MSNKEILQTYILEIAETYNELAMYLNKNVEKGFKPAVEETNLEMVKIMEKMRLKIFTLTRRTGVEIEMDVFYPDPENPEVV